MKKRIYKQIIKPILFALQPETAHDVIFTLLKYLAPLFNLRTKPFSTTSTTLMGIRFASKVGLAAGFDKNAELLNQWHHLGFGFVEVGTVTQLPQQGNPKPRLFRLENDQALINRMGFNNKGLEYMRKQLKTYKKRKVVVGVNIGKNTQTKNQDDIKQEYLKLFKALSPYADYITINISCPNIGDISILQENTYLESLLLDIQKENAQAKHRTPVLLKIAPHLSYNQLDDIINIVNLTGIDGVVATNTSSKREGLRVSQKELSIIGKGGVSGKPINQEADKTIQYLASKKSFVIIAVGGIMSSQDAIKKIDLGADLVQVYTGFVYKGPALIDEINKRI